MEKTNTDHIITEKMNNYINCELNYERKAHASMTPGLIQRSLIKSGDIGSDKSR